MTATPAIHIIPGPTEEIHASGVIHITAAPEEFYNSHHEANSGRFGAGKSAGSGSGVRPPLQDKLTTATKRRMLAGGNSGAGVELLSGPRGKAILKTNVPERDVDAEYLTSKMAKALGAPTPRVEKLSKNSMIMDHVAGQVGGKFSRGDRARIITLIGKKDRQRVVLLKGAKELGMLDFVTNNFDRHGANIIVRSNGKSVVGIDHTLTFQPQTPPVSSRAFENHWKPKFTRSDYDSARKKIAPLRPEFQKLGREDWFNQADRRLAKRGTKPVEAGLTESWSPEPTLLATGTISLTPDHIEELFNPNHDSKSGRFGAGHGGGSGGMAAKGPLHGEHVSKEAVAAARNAKLKKIVIGVGVAAVVTGLVVAGVKVNQNTLDGQWIKKTSTPGAKGAYFIETKNGAPIVLVDHDGLKPRQRKTLLRHTKDVHDMHPLSGGEGVTVLARGTHDLSPHAEAFTSPGIPNTILVNTDRFFNPKQRAADLATHGDAAKTYFMPSYGRGGVQGQERHLIFHEYGHLVDNDSASVSEKQAPKSRNLHRDVKAGRVHGMSDYGATNRDESYAETFAEYHTSGGKTTNEAARRYAQEFGWEVS